MNESGHISFRSRAIEGSEDMDMTPMVDVTFLLLIFFMITAAFALQRSFNVPTPNQDQPSTAAVLDELEEDDDFVIVRIDEFNTFYVVAPTWEDEEEATNEFDLLIKLRRAMNDESGRRVRNLRILAEGDAAYERVIMAIDAGNEIGVEEVQLVTVDSEV